MDKKLILFSALFILSSFALFGVASYEHGDNLLNEGLFEEGVAMLMVSHTEYWSNEQGQVIGKLVDYNLDPVSVNYCLVDVWYPNNKSLFIDSAVTDDTLQDTTGTHFHQFTTPQLEGVYEYMMTCNYNVTPALERNVTTSNSFHLSPALNSIGNVSEWVLQINSTLDGFNFSDLGLNVDEILQRTLDVNNTVNSIRTDQFTQAMAQSNFTLLQTRLDEVSTNLTAIEQFCDTPATSGSSLCLFVDEVESKIDTLNSTVNSNNELLNQLNSTANNIYDYMTVDLTTLVNNVFGNVNETLVIVNQINNTVNSIQTDVTSIKSTQENVVYMNVFSG